MQYGLMQFSTSAIRRIDLLTEFLNTLVDAYEGAALFDASFLWASDGHSLEFPNRHPEKVSLAQASAAINAKWGKQRFIERRAPDTSGYRNLIIVSIDMKSPGFWSFLGSINPLEVLRQYLNDRHQRKLDDQYRSEADRQRLALKNMRDLLLNMKLESEVVSSRLGLAKMVGATPEELHQIVDHYVARPMGSFLHVADKLNVIPTESITPVQDDDQLCELLSSSIDDDILG